MSIYTGADTGVLNRQEAESATVKHIAGTQ